VKKERETKILNLEHYINREPRKQKPPFNWQLKIFILRSVIKHKPKNEKFNCILPKFSHQPNRALVQSPQTHKWFILSLFISNQTNVASTQTPLNNQINSLNPKLQTPLTKKQASRTRSQAQAKLQIPTSQSLRIHFKSKPLQHKPTFSTPPHKKKKTIINH